MEHSSVDRTVAINWDCSVCGKSRLCPYSAPRLSGQAHIESCRTCGDSLAAQMPASDGALRAAIGNHLI